MRTLQQIQRSEKCNAHKAMKIQKEELNDGLCTWVRAFDGHFNISCANETRERANGNFKGKEQGATWEFTFCPYCGKQIQVHNAERRASALSGSE
jgi:hypothetical protein